MTLLEKIIADKEREIADAKKANRTIGDLKRMIRDAPPFRPFKAALQSEFGLIAELKKRSPSGGNMRPENVAEALPAYKHSRIVKAVSVLTNSKYFGMGIDELLRVKAQVNQPILRKDFLFKEYQIYESKAFGADAILLMANVLDREKMRRMYEVAKEVDLDVLFEAHTRDEIVSIPDDAEMCGINSRKFESSKRFGIFSRYGISHWLAERQFFWRAGLDVDLSTDLSTFSLVKHLPAHATKVAESGVRPSKLRAVRDLGFDSVLVGTCLLKAPEGVSKMLENFEHAIYPSAVSLSQPAAHPT